MSQIWLVHQGEQQLTLGNKQLAGCIRYRPEVQRRLVGS